MPKRKSEIKSLTSFSLDDVDSSLVCYFNLTRGVKGVDKGKLLDTVVAQEEASKDQDNLRQNNTKIAFYKYLLLL